MQKPARRRIPLLLAAVLGFAGFGLTQTPTRATTDPDAPYLMGWYLGPSSTEALTATSPWVTSGDYAGECSTTAADECLLPTRCSNNILTWNNGYTFNCGSAYSCVTFTIFETFPAGLPSASSVGCWQNWSAWTIYRTLPTPTSSSSVESTSTTADPTDTTPTPTATPDAEDGHGDTSSGSQAWIAGAVVGPVAGVAIIGAAAFYFLRRKRQPQYAAGPSASQPQDGSYYGPAAKHYSSQASELPESESRISELPAGTGHGQVQPEAYELPATRY